MTVNNPDPEPRPTLGREREGPVPPGLTPPADSGTPPGGYPPMTRDSTPVRTRNRAKAAVAAVCALVLLVAAFFLAYALVLML